jgi:hypothetical protein
MSLKAYRKLWKLTNQQKGAGGRSKFAATSPEVALNQAAEYLLRVLRTSSARNMKLEGLNLPQ